MSLIDREQLLQKRWNVQYDGPAIKGEMIESLIKQCKQIVAEAPEVAEGKASKVTKLIDAGPLRGVIRDWQFESFAEKGNEVAYNVLDKVLEYIDEAPAVASGRGSGEWIFLDRTDVDGEWYDKCSECGFTQKQDTMWLGAIPPYDYCPGCGAYMRDKKKVEGANK